MILYSVPMILVISCLYAIVFKTFYAHCSWDDTVAIALFAAIVGCIMKRILKL